MSEENMEQKQNFAHCTAGKNKVERKRSLYLNNGYGEVEIKVGRVVNQNDQEFIEHHSDFFCFKEVLELSYSVK